MDPGRYALPASDVELEELLEGKPPPQPEHAEPGTPEQDSESRGVPLEGPPEKDAARVHRNKTEAELGAEAKSKQHVYTHRPKNPYCDVCNRSKMLKHYARKTDGSRRIVAEGFGDHNVADFVLIRFQLSKVLMDRTTCWSGKTSSHSITVHTQLKVENTKKSSKQYLIS